MLRQFLTAYGKGLDATVRLIGMYIAVVVLCYGFVGVHWLASQVYPSAADVVTTVVGVITFPFIARIAINVAGLQKIPRSLPVSWYKPGSKPPITPPGPPPSPRSLPAGR